MKTTANKTRQSEVDAMVLGLLAKYKLPSQVALWSSKELAEVLALPDDPDMLFEYLKNKALSPMTIIILVQHVREAMRSSIALDAARQRHATARTAREWVREMWKNKLGQWDSYAAFARDHVGLVKEQFGVEVSARQIETVWLKGLPRAPKG